MQSSWRPGVFVEEHPCRALKLDAFIFCKSISLAAGVTTWLGQTRNLAVQDMRYAEQIAVSPLAEAKTARGGCPWGVGLLLVDGYCILAGIAI